MSQHLRAGFFLISYFAHRRPESSVKETTPNPTNPFLENPMVYTQPVLSASPQLCRSVQKSLN